MRFTGSRNYTEGDGDMNRVRVHAFALALATGFALVTGPAVAADKSGRYTPEPPLYQRSLPPIWQGFYAGGHLGYGELGDADGVVGGGQLGYNWQAGQIVYGIEGDASLSDISVEERVCVQNLGCANAEASIDWMATIRGRVGYLIDPRLLVYGTAGFGIVSASAEASVPGIKFTADDTESDFVYGLGLEGKISETMSARIEYLGFSDLDIDVVRAGLNFKLGQ